MDEKLSALVRERAQGEILPCAVAFRIAQDLGVTPQAVGETADALEIRLARCQLGLFGYDDPKRIVEPTETVSPELEQAIREGMILGRLPCTVAWAIANRFGIPKLHVANAVEKLEIRIAQCQLGAF